MTAKRKKTQVKARVFSLPFSFFEIFSKKYYTVSIFDRIKGMKGKKAVKIGKNRVLRVEKRVFPIAIFSMA